MAQNTPPQVAARTDQLIHSLAGEAGLAPSDRSPTVFVRWLALGVTLALITALMMVAGLSEVRADLARIGTTWTFQFKIVAMALLASAGVVLVRSAGVPGATLRSLWALAPGLLFMMAGVMGDDSGFPIGGRRPASVVVCVGIIVTAALPGLCFLLACLRRGIPTRLSYSGAVAGLLSGSLAALAYTIACTNDGAMFVALWYVAAILITAVIGAVAGRYALAW